MAPSILLLLLLLQLLPSTAELQSSSVARLVCAPALSHPLN
jgi:hypothetical protein